MKKPVISIVTPCYNMVEYLEETIESVLSQQYPALEYIIIDGGSTDGSVDIIRRYEKHLTYWTSEADRGMYDAVQKGFEKSTGEIMGWLNSDDLLHRGALYVLADIFTTLPQVSWITATPSYADERGRLVGCREVESWSKYRFYIGEYRWIPQESTFWKRELWEKAGAHLRTDMQYAGDFELWLRFFRHERLYSSNALLGAFRGRKGNQKSAEGLAAYEKEAAVVWQEEILQLDRTEQKKIKKINMMHQLLFNRPVVGNLHKVRKIKEKLMEFPGKIYFNRKIQKFYLSN